MKLRDYIFCDDIRHEQHNKISLMGLYNDRIVFKTAGEKPLTWPLPIRLATFLRIEFEGNEEKPDSFNFSLYLNDETLADISGSLKVDLEQSMANISVNGEGLPVEPGALGFKLALKAGAKELFNKEVKSALILLNEHKTA